MKQALILMLPVALLACAEDADNAAIRENPANAVDARTVTLRLDIAVQVPDAVRPNLAVVVNGETQEMVDVPVDPQADRQQPDPDADEADGERVPVLSYASVHYERMIAWGDDGSTRDLIQAVQPGSGLVLGEGPGLLRPLCSTEPLPAPVEVYYRAAVSYAMRAGDEQPVWRIELTSLGCIYADTERDRHADS